MEMKDWFLAFLDVNTIVLCVVCKLPQITRIFQSKSLAGVSLNSVIAELLGYSIVLGYNVVKGYPVSTYMEYIFLVVQDVALIFVIFYYMGTLDFLKVGMVGVYLTAFYSFSLGIPHPMILPVLMRFATPCSAGSKVMQLLEMFKIKSSESVSILTWLISAYTCVTRIITNVMVTGDAAILINLCIALVLNIGIVSSAYYFRKSQKVDPPLLPGTVTTLKDEKLEKKAHVKQN